jgi:hypothetical protein
MMLIYICIYICMYVCTYICREIIKEEVGAVEALEFMCSSADITAAKYAQASKTSKAYIIIIIIIIIYYFISLMHIDICNARIKYNIRTGGHRQSQDDQNAAQECVGRSG